MTVEAMGWVMRHSPFRGATFLVHLMIADLVNPQHNHEIWMTQNELADRSRVSDRSVRRALDELIEDGFIVQLEDNAAAGRPNRYRFEYPEVPVIYANFSTGTGSRVGHGVQGGRTRRPGGSDRVSDITTKNPNEQKKATSSDKPTGFFLPGTGWISEFSSSKEVDE